MKTHQASYDLVVCGGGLAGLCAALAAARLGCKTCLIQDRPVLGGNSSSEIRVTPHGSAAFHDYARETGIISELLMEERSRNHETINENGWVNSVWDMTLYDAVQSCPNLTLHLNTRVLDVELEDGRLGRDMMRSPAAEALDVGFVHRPSLHTAPVCLRRVRCEVANAETEWWIEGRTFVDATGDGVVADLAGCEWRLGEESQEEFGEPHAPARASSQTMGNSIHFRCRDMGRPCPFTPPDWAVHHQDPAFFYEQGRKPHDPRGGFWWIEIGVPWHTIHDNEEIRHQLTRHALGVWDWMKNKDPQMMEKTANYALEFIGQVPGKRESRRIIGAYFMTEHDVMKPAVFQDEIAFGGWFLDLHTPGGLLAPTSEPASAEGYNPKSEYAAKSYCGPYGIPLGVLLSRDVSNLMMAGRNVSVTHAALGTVRVMATTALMGQAAGTCAALALQKSCTLSEIREQHIRELQQQLLRDGCFLPNVPRSDPADLAPAAHVVASSEATLTGADPEAPHVGPWNNRASSERSVLRETRGQWIACGNEGIEALEVLLQNLSGDAQPVRARLWPVEHIWDYRVSPGTAPLAETLLTVPPGGPAWLRWNCAVPAASLVPGAFVRLDLEANPAVSWCASGSYANPGCVAAFAMNQKRMRRLHRSERPSFRVLPPQSAYPASSVLSGAARPHLRTHLWRSDPALPLPQWLELRWEQPRTFQQIELSFPGQLLNEYHEYPPFFRDPQCPRDYTLESWDGTGWAPLLDVRGNYHRHRKHRLPAAVTSARLRLQVTATNGDPSAALYEIRVYA